MERRDPLLRRYGSLSMEWLERFPEVVGLSPLGEPDVIFLQEGKWFNHYGDELLLYVERLLRAAGVGRYRGFLTLLRRSPHHPVVFINTQRLSPVHHWRGGDPDEPCGLLGWVEVIVAGDEDCTLWLKSVHLDPRDGDVRLTEVRQMHAAVPVGQRAMLAGDFNSITSRRLAEDGEPQRRFGETPLARRFHKGVWPATQPGGDTDPDTRALDYLLDCGWVCQHIALNTSTPTTREPGRGGELIVDRCLTMGALARRSLWVDDSDLLYSDHRAVAGQVVIVGRGTP